MGDLNGRTRTDEGFVGYKDDKHSPINNVILYSKDQSQLSRANLDEHVVDEQGKLILALCKNSSMRILNGRTPGDMEGNFTRYPSNLNEKPSTIDYALCSETLIKEVTSFSVLPFCGLSDHCCISLTMKSNGYNVNCDNIFLKTKKVTDHQLKANKLTYTFDKSRKHVYVQALKDDLNVEVLRSTLAQANVNPNNMDGMISQVNDILLNAAKKASFTKRSRCLKKLNTQNTQEWYSRECKTRQKILRQCSKKLSLNPFDGEKRHNFIKARADYKKVCRKAESAGRQKLTKKLIEIGQNDPKLFWKTIKQMNNWGKKKNEPTDDISMQAWMNYFENLLNDENPPPNASYSGTRTFEPILAS